MSTRVSIDVSQLPVGGRLDTYEDGTVWLRNGGTDEHLRQYAQRVGSGPGRTDDIDLTAPAGTRFCEQCGAPVADTPERLAAWIAWGKILCVKDTPGLQRRPDTGARRRKTDLPAGTVIDISIEPELTEADDEAFRARRLAEEANQQNPRR